MSKSCSSWAAAARVAGAGRILRCLVKGNSASSGGGVSIVGSGVVENSLITGNRSHYGAAQMNSMSAWLVNCTVAGNSSAGQPYPGVWLEDNGGNTLNCVAFDSYSAKGWGTTSHCALGVTPQVIVTPSQATFDKNVTVDSGIFEDTTGYRPKKGTALHGNGSNAGYAEHAVSATDYEGSPRRRGRRIDIGHIELPPKDGMMLFVR